MWRGIGAVVVAAALAGPAAADAASGWVPGFDEVAPSDPSSYVVTPVAVVTPDLRTVAFWIDYPRIRAAVRPRGGTFGDPFVFDEDDSDGSSLGAIALPDGEVLAAWSGDINEEMEIKSLQPDGTVADARPAEPGGSYPALAANDAGMVAVAYYSGLNQVYLAIRPAGADTFEPPILLLTLVGNEQPGSTTSGPSAPLDIAVRDDSQVAVAIGTSVLNPPGGTARMLIARYAGGTTSIETVDYRALTLTPAPGTSADAEFRGAIESLSDDRQLLVYRVHTATNGVISNELRGGPRDGSSAPPPPLIDQSSASNSGPIEHGLTVDDASRPWLWWRQEHDGGDEELRVRQATAAGAFSAPSQVLASPEFGTVDMAAFGNGRTGVLFTQDGKVKASTSEGGAAFGAPIDVATPGAVTPPPSGSVALAGAGEGSAVALWPDGATVQTAALHATPFDATPPTLQGLQAPESLTAGVQGTFIATVADDWSVPSVSWLFGDGVTLTGSTVQRAFPSAGSFTATATATDAAGNTATGTRTVAVSAAPVDPPTGPPSNAIKLGKPKLNKKRGTAKLPVTVPGPGTLALAGKGVGTQTTTPTAPITMNMPVKARGKKLKGLNATGKMKLEVTVTYTPTGGTANTESRKLVLKKLLDRR